MDETFSPSQDMIEDMSSCLKVELASRAGGSGWAEPTPGQENNRADRARPDLNRAAISLTQPCPISG